MTANDEEEQRSKLPGTLSNPQRTHTGNTGTDPQASGTPEANDEEAFARVGNEIRVEIVRTLGQCDFEHSTEATLSFSDLRSKSNTDVASSQFNHHLQELVGRYVEKPVTGTDCTQKARTSIERFVRRRSRGEIVSHRLDSNSRAISVTRST